jgi:hypothetical protein
MISQLDARRAAFNQATDEAIAALRKLAAFSAQGISAGLSANGTSSSGKPSAQDFYGLNLADAAKKYLRVTKEKATNKEIAAGLDAIGYIHNSTNLANNVGTALWRAEQNSDPDLVRHGRYWLLTEWGIRKPKTRKFHVASLNPNDMLDDDDAPAEDEAADD